MPSQPLLALCCFAGAGAASIARPAVAQPAAEHAVEARAVEARAVEGEVVQAETGAPLPGATVALLPAAPGALAADAGHGAFVAGARRVVTGANGRYRFADVAPGAYVLRVYRLGFRPATVEVELRGDGATAGTGAARVSVGLTVVPIRLRPVAVEAAAPEPYARRARTVREVADARTTALRARQVRYLSTDVREVTHADVEDAVTLGETDLFRALQRLPGVATQGDASAQLWTRGARWDQTRVTFDGLPLFNPLHAGGPLSAVSADAIGAAFLLPGVRPASVGEGSAGVIDLKSRAGGGTGALRGAGELSMISARATLDQTVDGGRGAWMLSARRSYLDVVARRIVNDTSADPFPYHLGELAGRADWRFGDGRTLEVSGLRSRDQLGTDGTMLGMKNNLARWGNTAARATFTTPARLGPLGPITLRQTFGVSTYAGAITYDVVDTRPSNAPSNTPSYPANSERPVEARIAYTALSGEITPTGTPVDTAGGRVGGAVPWTAGYALALQRTTVGGALAGVYSADVDDSAVVNRRATLPVLALWGERRLTPARGLTVTAGLRVEVGTPVHGDGPVRPAPRLTARYAFGDGATVLSAAAGRHFQYLQGVPQTSMNRGGGGEAILRPVPLWLAADRDTPALRTDLATVGLERWTGAGWDWTLNAYVRHSAGLLMLDERPGVPLGRPLFTVAGETGRGVEFGVRRVIGRWTGTANYALASATTAAYGLRFPSAEDRRHVFNATAGVRVGGGGHLGAAFTSLSGAPFTPLALVVTALDSARYSAHYAFGAPSAERFPTFRRLDVSAEWTWAVRRVRVGGYVQLINALQRDNPLGVASFDLVCPAAGAVGCKSGREPPHNGFWSVPLVGFRASF